MADNRKHKHLHDDNGYKSRKFWYAVGTSAAILIVSVVAGLWAEPLLPSLATVIGGLLTALTIYSGVNATTKVAMTKATKPEAPPPEDPSPKP